MSLQTKAIGTRSESEGSHFPGEVATPTGELGHFRVSPLCLAEFVLFPGSLSKGEIDRKIAGIAQYTPDSTTS